MDSDDDPDYAMPERLDTVVEKPARDTEKWESVELIDNPEYDGPADEDVELEASNVVERPGFMSVGITDYEKDEESKRTKFSIRITHAKKTWQVQRYYTDFEHLRKQLSLSENMSTYVNGFPAKHSISAQVKKSVSKRLMIGRSKQLSQDALFLLGRMESLNIWLRRICNAETVAKLRSFAPMDTFLEISDHS
eukprot:m.179720 g.179720  ORF g.179720 m.179720 type:complete len:193 (+) comp18395_c0_seq18:418-996(+)